MAGGYTLSERHEIKRYFTLVVDELERLAPEQARRLYHASRTVAEEVRDPTFAMVLVAHEIQRGVNKDQRAPISSPKLPISPALQGGLRSAFEVGTAMAPLVLDRRRSLVQRLLRQPDPRFGQEAREAILRCRLVHSGSAMRDRLPALRGPAGAVAPR